MFMRNIFLATLSIAIFIFCGRIAEGQTFRPTTSLSDGNELFLDSTNSKENVFSIPPSQQISFSPLSTTDDKKMMEIEHKQPIKFPEKPASIIISSDKLEAAPGETIKISATAKGKLEKVLFGWGQPIFDNDDIKIDDDGLGMEIKIPDSYSGEFSVRCTGLLDEDFAYSNEVHILVKPDMRQLVAISFNYGDYREVISTGSKLSLEVIGLFDPDSSDFKRYDISNHKMGTTYASNNASVATVSEDGEVTGVSPGEATITVRNGSAGILYYLKVVPL